MVLLFSYQIFDEFSPPHRTIYRLVAGVMVIIGVVLCAIMAWARKIAVSSQPKN